jgi:hypothetical protein
MKRTSLVYRMRSCASAVQRTSNKMAPPVTALSKSDSLIPLVPTLSLMPQDNRQVRFATRVGQAMSVPEIRRGFVIG